MLNFLQNIIEEVKIMFKTALVFIYVSFGSNKTDEVLVAYLFFLWGYIKNVVYGKKNSKPKSFKG